MSKKKTTKRRSAKPLPPVSESFDASEQKTAKHVDKSILALRLIFASGQLPPDDAGLDYEYLETVGTAVEVAQHFNVSEKTISTWRRKGCPGRPGSYPLEAIRHWRLSEPDPPEWLYRGNSELCRAEATGDLSRAILRVVRTDLPRAVSRATKDFVAGLKHVDRSDDKQIEKLLYVVLAKHLEPFRLDDAAIEKLLAETWGLA